MIQMSQKMQSWKLGISARKRCYCIDLWLNIIMCKRKIGLLGKGGKWCHVARWLNFVIFLHVGKGGGDEAIGIDN